MALALHNLGYVALHREELEKAGELFAESLSLYEDWHYYKGVTECLAGLGSVELADGRLDKAARLYGAMEAILEHLGTRLDTLDRIDSERTHGSLRSRFSEKLDTLLDEGKTMPRERAVEYALADRNTKRKKPLNSVTSGDRNER